MRQSGAIESLYQQYGDDVQFLLIYIREAHPNSKHPQPTEMAERVSHAEEMCEELKLTIPTLIDGLEDKVGTRCSPGTARPTRVKQSCPASRSARRKLKSIPSARERGASSGSTSTVPTVWGPEVRDRRPVRPATGAVERRPP